MSLYKTDLEDKGNVFHSSCSRFHPSNDREFHSSQYENNDLLTKTSDSRSLLGKQLQSNQSWKLNFERNSHVTVLDRPVEREVRKQFDILLNKQKKAPFLNQGDWQYNKQKINFIMNNTTSSGIINTRERKLPMYQYYDTRRQAMYGEDMGLNKFI